MKKWKFLLVPFAIFLLSAPACKKNTVEPDDEHNHQEHTHEVSTTYEYDDLQHWHTCSGCDEKLDLENHIWNEGEVTKNATCTTNGEITYTCTVCEATKVETIAASHDTSGEWVYNDENHWKVCPVCENKILEEAHNYDEGEVIKLPTKFETGLKVYTCETCGHTKEEVVEKLSDKNLNVLFSGSALIRNNSGFTQTFAGLAASLDERTINYTMSNELTPTSGYSFKALFDEETTLGAKFKETIEDGDYDIIVLQVTRMIAKNHDSVANAELNYLKSYINTLKEETSQIYLLTYQSDESYTVFDVDENGEYARGAKENGAIENTHYYFEKATEWASETGVKVINYGESYLAMQEAKERHSLKASATNLANYLRGACLYEGIFNNLITDESTYQHPETELDANDLHYVRRYAAQYCYKHEHIADNEVLFDSHNHWKECEICNEHLEEHAHELERVESSFVAPSCTQEGSAHFVCKGCNYSIDEHYDKLDHQIGSEWLIDGDYHYHACATCEEKFDREAHTWNSGVITLEPTHLAKGEKTFTCTKCGATKVEEIDKLTEHTFSNWTKVDDDTHSRSCECGEVETEAHTWNSGVVTKEATFTEEGERTYTCTKCGATKIEVIPMLVHTEHTPDETWHKDESYHWHVCTFEGCSEILDKAAHTWNEGVVTLEPTHLAKGEKTYTCTVCGQTKVEEIDKLADHEFGDWTYVDASTHKHTCACGEEETEAHTWNDGVITTPATRSTKGVKTYTCTKCGGTKTEELDTVTTNVLLLGTANMNNYTMDVHLAGLANEAGYKTVSATYLTLGSGYGFNAIADTSTEESYGSKVNKALKEQDFDVIILSINRMVNKGSDDVIAAEEEHLETIIPTLKEETEEIYLMSFNLDWNTTPKKYIVNEDGTYSADGNTEYTDKETSKYYDELGASWATAYELKLIRYSSCYVEYREDGNAVSANTLQYIQGCLLYNSLFNVLVDESSQYHKTIVSSFKDASAKKIREFVVNYSTYQA